MLTAREWQVVDCVAEGMSNIDIARALSITNRTVQSHLSHIFSKLSAENRVQVLIKVGYIQKGIGNGSRD